MPSARPTSNVTQAVQHIRASLPNLSHPAQTSQPNHGNTTLNPPLGMAVAAPAAPSGLVFHKTSLRGVNAPTTGVDVNTIPISAGVSVAPVGSQQPPQLSQQQWASGSVAGTSKLWGAPSGTSLPGSSGGRPYSSTPGTTFDFNARRAH